MALWLGNTITLGTCRHKYHDDKKHPDELIHFQQKAVGQVTDENVEKCQKGEKVHPRLVGYGLLKAPHTKRQIDTQKQQKTNQTRIQQDVKKAVIGKIDLIGPFMADLYQDPEAFLHPQRAVPIT